MGDVPNGGRTVTLGIWHVVVLLCIQFAGIAVAWGELRQEVSDLRDRTSRIESNSVITRAEFDAWRTEMLNRMDRIEQDIIRRNLGLSPGR